MCKQGRNEEDSMKLRRALSLGSWRVDQDGVAATTAAARGDGTLSLAIDRLRLQSITTSQCPVSSAVTCQWGMTTDD